MDDSDNQVSLPAARTTSRRRVLQATGAGLGAAVLTRSGVAAAAPPNGPTPEPAAATSLPLVGGSEFPIGIFWPPPPLQATTQRWQEIADAGFTFVITGNYAEDRFIIGYQLGLADAVGLKVLIADDPSVADVSRNFTISDDRFVPLSITTADARTLFQQSLDLYAGHPSLAGFNLYDEPQTDRYPSLAKAFGVARTLAPGLLPYANLLPGNGEAYRTYVSSYVRTVKPSLLSFDRYPIVASGEDTGYFENLAIVRQEAAQAGIPPWVYVQTLGYNAHRTPTAAELLWQIDMALAYGYKGIQYFTYWTPDPARGEGFQPALLTVDGHRTERYAVARRINTTWLTPVGRQLKPLTSVSVVHANESPVPVGATAFAADGLLTATSGDAVVIGRFAKAGNVDRSWLFVANRSGQNVASAQLSLHRSVTAVARFNPATGQYVKQARASRITVRLDPGAAGLYRLN